MPTAPSTVSELLGDVEGSEDEFAGEASFAVAALEDGVPKDNCGLLEASELSLEIRTDFAQMRPHRLQRVFGH